MDKINLNIVCIVQARMSSSRLPEKMMMELNGIPVIEQVFRQLSFSKKINQRVLATSVDASDNKLFDWAVKKNIPCIRGSLDDVLDRFYNAAKIMKADIAIRVTGDCPLIDPEIIDKTIQMHLENEFDYTSNANPPTFPDGYDVEVVNFSSLEKAWKEAGLKSEREHVTPYIKNHKELFNIGNFEWEINYEQYRLTLDNKEDFELISIIHKKFYNENNFIKLNNVIEFLLENPKLIEINNFLVRNEGYQKSLKSDKKIT
jgi:spore coat polysaccharide biosynthesis protein SpsF (cytidylyltransferase family)